MKDTEEQQMVIINAVDTVCESYLNTSFKKLKASCNGDHDKAMQICMCLTTLYRLKDDIKVALVDSQLDF